MECKADFALVLSIANIPKREVQHESCKGEVCNRLAKRSRSTGVIDEDPSATQPGYLKRAMVKSDLTAHGLKVLYDGSNHNTVIVLRPRLEDWVLRAAREAGIDVKKYGLPEDAAPLHRHINIRLEKFTELLTDLKSCERLQALAMLLISREVQ